METVAIVVGAGEGRRLGGVCKALLELDGKPLLCYSLEVFQRSSLIAGIVVAVPPGRLRYFREVFPARWPFKKVIAWVAGGERRQDSVAAALGAVPHSTTWIAVHDAARPFVTERLLGELMAAAKQTGAAVPGVTPTDSIKEVGSDGIVEMSPERRKLRAVQTPQVFSAELIRRAYGLAERGGHTATDDAALVEKLGHPVKVIEGDYDNIKITRPIDLEAATRIIRKRLTAERGTQNE